MKTFVEDEGLARQQQWQPYQKIKKQEESMNCWEFKKCGREAGGAKEKVLGACPAYPNHGKHCARIAGTMCGGKVQGSFAQKVPSCMQCDFYKSANYDKAYKG